VQALAVLPARHLLDVTAHLQGSTLITPLERSQRSAGSPRGGDLAEVHGQAQARRALEIAAAGRLNLLMMGPPGSGKSMLASRLSGILPPLSEAEALETAAVHSVAGLGFDVAAWCQRPFRNPHHTASGAALIGGGANPLPGEISLAHNGVLFLDELAEFPSNVLDGLREPLETRQVLISRAARRAIYPADFQLVGAMNPCKCGFALDPQRACASCSPVNTERYQRRLSGPLRDRIDLQIEVPAMDHTTLVTGLRSPAEPSSTVAERVASAWQRQRDRQGTVNARLDQAGLSAHCRLPPKGEVLLETASKQLHLSARAFHRVLRVARTIADLEGADQIAIDHLAEAISLRRLAVSRV
jgi:magnesium chelatase family protein